MAKAVVTAIRAAGVSATFLMLVGCGNIKNPDRSQGCRDRVELVFPNLDQNDPVQKATYDDLYNTCMTRAKD
jgi:hypothetical protein